MMRRILCSLVVLLVAAAALGASGGQIEPRSQLEPHLQMWTLEGEGFDQLRVVGTLARKLPDGKYETKGSITYDVCFSKSTVNGKQEKYFAYTSQLAGRHIELLAKFVAEGLGWFHKANGTVTMVSLSLYNGDQLKLMATVTKKYGSWFELELPVQAYDLDLSRATLRLGDDEREFDSLEARMVMGNVNAISAFAMRVHQHAIQGPKTSFAYPELP